MANEQRELNLTPPQKAKLLADGIDVCTHCRRAVRATTGVCLIRYRDAVILGTFCDAECVRAHLGDVQRTFAPNDAVDHPAHYTQGRIEVIDFLVDQQFGLLDGNVVKYLCRYRHKGNALEDLKKARWYLNRLIEELSHGTERE